MVFSNVVGGLGIHYGVVPLIRRVPNLYIDITGVLEILPDDRLRFSPSIGEGDRQRFRNVFAMR